MANELAITTTVTLNKGGCVSRGASRSSNFTQTGVGYVAGKVQAASDAHKIIPMGEVASAGAFFFQNLSIDGIAYVGCDDGAGNFVPFLELAPGTAADDGKGGIAAGSCLGTNTPYVKASAGTPWVEYWIAEE